MKNKQGPLFLRGSKMLLETLEQAIVSDDSQYIYIIGKDTKFIVDNVIKAIIDIDTDEAEKSVHIVLHSLTGKEFSSTSFLYLISKLAGRIRISNKAAHNLIVTETTLIFASVDYRTDEDDWVCGVAIYDKDELEKAQKYCKELWEHGLALRLQ